MATHRAPGQLRGEPWKVDACSKKDKNTAGDRIRNEEYATAQMAQLEVWKAHEAEVKAQQHRQKLAYSQQLRDQAAADKARKQQADAFRKRGPVDGTLLSTGRGGTAVNTIRTASGELTPYVLEENAVLSTLGTTIRFAVVSALDGTAIKPAKKKSSQYFIE